MLHHFFGRDFSFLSTFSRGDCHLKAIIIKGANACGEFIHPYIPALPVPAPISVLVLDLEPHGWNTTPRNELSEYLERHPGQKIDYLVLLNQPVELSPGGLKPVTYGHFKTSHSEAGES